MRVVVIGGSGTIGSRIVTALDTRHEVIVATSKSTDVMCDISSYASIEQMFQKVGPIDALVIAAGTVHFEPLTQMNEEKYSIGLQSKLMGQVRCVLIGAKYLQEGGSFTLTSGILSDDPIVAGSSASMVNGAIDCYVRAAAIELPRALRINAVSPSVVTESWDQYGSYFPGFESVSADRVANAFVKSVEGKQTGQIYRVWA